MVTDRSACGNGERVPRRRLAIALRRRARGATTKEVELRAKRRGEPWVMLEEDRAFPPERLDRSAGPTTSGAQLMRDLGYGGLADGLPE